MPPRNPRFAFSHIHLIPRDSGLRSSTPESLDAKRGVLEITIPMKHATFQTSYDTRQGPMFSARVHSRALKGGPRVRNVSCHDTLSKWRHPASAFLVHITCTSMSAIASPLATLVHLRPRLSRRRNPAWQDRCSGILPC